MLVNPRPRSRQQPWSSEQLLLTALLIPTLFYDLVLEGMRLLGHFDEILRSTSRMESLDWLGVFASPLLFHFGLVLLLAGLVSAGARLRLRTPAMLIAQFICAATVLVDTAADVYFRQTSSALDWAEARLYLVHPSDVGLVARGTVSGSTWAALLAVELAILAGPWVLLFIKRRGSEASSSPLAWIAIGVFLVGGPVVATMGFLPWTEFALDTALVCDPVLHFIATTAHARRPDLALAEAEARAGKPFDLRIARARPVAPMNVVYVILESTRARSTTPYNPGLLTTPFLAELAKKSLVVDRAYTVIPHTARALVALLCGLEPSHNFRPKAVALGLLSRCLPQLLDEQGYQSVFFQSAAQQFESRIPTTTSMGFQQFIGTESFGHEGFERANWLGYDDEVMLDPSRNWLETHKGKPIFATYMTVNAHQTVEPLERYGFQTFDPDPEVNNYENAIRADDFFLRALIDQWKAAGLYENTLWVIVGDHGEGMGEHGRRAHDSVPWEEGLRIPLIIHDPTGVRIRPGHNPGPTNQLDVVPTLLSALGYKVTHGALHGNSLTRRHVDRPVMAACLGDSNCLVEIAGNEKLIHFFGHRPDEYYDLGIDPYEHTNLLEYHRKRAARMLEDLLLWDSHIKGLYWAEELLAQHDDAN